MSKFALFAPATALALAVPCGATAQRPEQPVQAPTAMGAMDSTDQPAAAAAHEAMSGPMARDPHLKLTPLRGPTAAATARAARLVADIRAALDAFRDVRVAQTQGFRQFLPGVKQPVYHFTNWWWAREEMFRFNPAKPTSLLYRQDPGGALVLVGAMYSAPARASLEQLDRRIPLSVARWHEHVNWCLPPAGQAARWREVRDGTPVFGPKSPIATAEACARVGGRFVPRMFGWMVHVMAFASEDPKVIWGGGHEHP